MQHQLIIDMVTKHLEKSDAIKALFLGGSYGKGTQDAFSDLDFVAIAESDHHEAIATNFREALEALEPLVLWRARIGPASLLNATIESWERIDLIIVQPANLTGRVQSGLRPLIDPSHIYATLPETSQPYQHSGPKIAFMIEEFIRVLGLAPLALGRGELVTMALGLSLLRDMVRDLMLEECPLADRGGALHLSKLISQEDMAVLQALPYPGPDRDALIAGHIEVAEVFFARARPMAKRLKLEWPDTFEQATRAHLKRSQGITFR